ncbi:succinylglutamate desuccinylase/aspartoacylase family protein [Alienimonas chondri]|uniref:succinylglutamate desuccinylase/aspartoacylase family protein n=1 Tax=Alienimonas chondri TaxID=2681879 RepID=UPI0019D56B1D|nr:succinylglutamate desuccinylase/aspartoacylase family protein [Alienimonas chondri]
MNDDSSDLAKDELAENDLEPLAGPTIDPSEEIPGDLPNGEPNAGIDDDAEDASAETDTMPADPEPPDLTPRTDVPVPSQDGAAIRPLTVGGTVCPAGARTHVELPVGRLPTETWLNVPVEIVRGERPGPTVWLTAAIHGDELNGVEVIRRVLAKVTCEKLRGTLLAVPIVNVFGFNARSRYLPDRRDLNRSFPGSASGSSASQLAHLLMTEVVAHADVGLDLHTGSDHRFNLPQIRANLEDAETLRLAEAFHAPVTMHSGVRDGSLRGAATALGKPVLLYEAGEPQRFNGESIEVGVRGVLSVLRALDMLPPRSAASKAKHPDPPPSVRVPSSTWVRAKRSGIFRPTANLGVHVSKGDRLGGIADAFGRNRSALKAPFDGVVIARANNPLVHRGDGVVHLGRVE